ncbi:zinc finger protein zfs1 [Phtheirospermum japonicum]|uniref:Zinc finger protein zfs1 n=1 Tax=Phtheirospermum japonicum TaxID=374723 RepID=A0A830CHC7_9LAMI|nr:zinc finger protein zfs1 [Phtheirospermum japonicum]
MEIQRDSITPKLKSLDGVVSPINVLNLPYGRRRTGSLFDPYASDSSDSPSPLMKYLRSADSKPNSPPAFVTPVKVEEDVIVMDGIPLPKSSKGGSEVRTRLPLMSSSSFNSNYGGGRSNSTLSPASGGGGVENIKPQRNTLCRFWKTCGTCQFGSECQFAHGKEELQRPPRSSGKIKHEIFKSNINLEGSASPSYGKNYSPISQAKSLSAAEEAFSSPSLPSAMAFSTAPVQVKHLSGSAIPSSTAPKAYSRRSDWSPLDDGIEINLPFAKNPSKGDVDAYIEKVLSGTNSGKRLPVFVEICPD